MRLVREVGRFVLSAPRSWVARYGVAVLAVLAAFGIKLLLGSFLLPTGSFTLLTLVVVVSAVFGGLGPGVFATLIAAFLGDYFFLEPLYTFVPPTAKHGLQTGLFMAQGLAISLIGSTLTSAKRNTEEALESSRRAEENYRGIFENAVDGIFRATGDGRILTANPTLSGMLGYESPKDLISSVPNYAGLYEEPEQGEEFMETLSRDGEVRDFDLRLKRKDGGGIRTSISCRVMHEDDEGHMLFEGIIEDTTESKRAEDELRLRDRAISESANGIVITDARAPDNPVVYVNPAFESITGYSAEDVIGRNCRFLQGADRYQPALEELREAIREEQPCTVVIRNYRKNGTPFWNELSVSPVRDESGDVTHFIGVQEDVTESRRAEEVLRRSEDRLRQATEAADLGTWDYNLVYGRLVWDERCKEIFDLPPDARVDYEVFLSRLHPDERERTDAAVKQALDPESGGELEIEHRTVSHGGGPGRWVDARGQAFFDEDGQPVRLIGTMQDITARKRDEEGRHLLAEAGSELASSLDYQANLSRTVRLMVPDFADWCAVDMLSEQGEIRRLAVEHQDPEKVRWAHELQRRYPPDPGAATGLPQVLRSGEAEFYPEITDEMLTASIEDEERLEMLREIGFASAMIVPLIARERVLGAITFVTSESGRRYDRRDLDLAGELARRAAVAVDNARLYDEAQKELDERRRTQEALRQSEDRYRTFIEQSAEGIWRFELEEPIPVELPEDEQIERFYQHAYLAECNDAMARMYGYSRAEELEGARLGDMLPRSIPENLEYLEGFIRSRYSLNNVESQEFDRYGNPRFFLNNLTGIVEDGLLARAWGTQRDITERKQVERALEESEEQYRVVAETASDGIVMIDEDSRILFANGSTGRVFGYSTEELIGQHLTMLMPEYLRQVHEASLARFIETGERHVNWDSIQLPGLHESGREIPLEVSFGEFVKEGRRFFTGFLRDITERKQAEEVLRRSEERFRATFEQAAVGVAHVGLDGRWLRVNQRLADMVGYSHEELLEKTFQDITHPDDLEADLAYLRQLLAGEIQRYSTEKRYFRKDGSILWIDLTVSLVRDPSGEPEYFVSVIEDVSERKQAEEALEQSEARFRSLVQNSSDVITVVSADGTIFYQSPSIERVLGYRAEDRIGTNAFESMGIHPDDMAKVRDLFAGLLERPCGIASEEIRLRHADGSWRVVEVAAGNLLEDPAVGGIVSNFRDITDRKSAEERASVRARQQAMVAGLGDQALATTDLQTLFDETAERVAEVLDVEYSSVLELLPGGEAMVLRAGAGWREGAVGSAVVSAGLDSQAGYTLASDDPVEVEDLRSEDRFTRSPLLQEHGVVSGTTVMIEGQTGPFGILGAHAREQRTFTEDDVNFLQAVANVIATAVERRNAETALREAKEAEQVRIAQDLHDTVLQDMAFAVQEMNVRQILAESQGEDEAQLEEISETLRRGIESLRAAVFELRLQGETERSFVGSLESLVDLNRRMARHSYTIGITVGHDFPEHLSETARVEVTRIVQEALSNARKHANANHVHVSLGVENGYLSVEVADDGRGFDPHSFPGGLGTSSMHRRARNLGGEVKIDGQPGKGMRVRFQAPRERLVGE